MAGTDHREPVFRLGIANRVTAGERPASFTNLRRRSLEHRGEGVARQLLGERRDREREEDAAAHREHVTERVGSGDLAVGSRVVDERREEVERADDREVVTQPVDGSVVGRREAGDQLIGCCRGAKTDQSIGQEVRAELGRATPAIGQFGQPGLQRYLDACHEPIIRPAPVGPAQMGAGSTNSPGSTSTWCGRTRQAMTNAQAPRNADHGPAAANPPDSMMRPLTIGPTTPPRFSALPLNASIVPRAVLDIPATIVCIPGTPNHVPNAQIDMTTSESGSATTDSGSRNAAVANNEIPASTTR